jgi:hypothetical protein
MQRFENLLSVALADGRLTEREMRLLSERAREWRLDDHQFTVAVNHCLERPGHLRIPDSREERAELLRDALSVMASDGQLMDAEKRLFAFIAARMEFSAAEIDAIIMELVVNKDAKAPSNQVGSASQKATPSKATAASKAAKSPKLAKSMKSAKPLRPAKSPASTKPAKPAGTAKSAGAAKSAGSSKSKTVAKSSKAASPKAVAKNATKDNSKGKSGAKAQGKAKAKAEAKPKRRSTAHSLTAKKLGPRSARGAGSVRRATC